MASSEVSRLLAAAADGDRASESRLFNVVYAELKRMASAQLQNERAGHTLQPTALVNELYLKMLGGEPVRWENRAHFFASAAKNMRSILVDHARAHRAKKRTGALDRVELPVDLPSYDPADVDTILAVDQLLDRLAEWEPRQAQVVELRFFGGQSVEEVADLLRVSPKTVKRDWSMARAWLNTQWTQTDDGPDAR